MSNRIIVYKEKRRLELWGENGMIKSYKVGLGFTPKGAKSREGDGRVPEGDYYICTKNEKSKFTLFMGLSYPNADDAAKGFEAGLISESEKNSIIESNRKRKRPDWETNLGGKIGIHGKGSSFDWTAGCIALEDEDICELWEYMEKGDEVIINP